MSGSEVSQESGQAIANPIKTAYYLLCWVVKKRQPNLYGGYAALSEILTRGFFNEYSYICHYDCQYIVHDE